MPVDLFHQDIFNKLNKIEFEFFFSKTNKQ